MTSSMRPPGRPLNAAIDEHLLRVTQDLLIEEGFERLTMDEVARRCGASKATIYRRWPGKTALVVAAAAALFRAPDPPDTGDLREDLLACGRAYVQTETRNAQVLASVISASRHDAVLREASQQALGAPYSGLFERVLTRAVERGLIHHDLDLETLAQVFPALAYQKVAALGLMVGEADVLRAVDGVLLPAISHRGKAPVKPHNATARSQASSARNRRDPVPKAPVAGNTRDRVAKARATASGG